MKTTRIVLSLIIVLAILWCADISAHQTSTVVRHFEPCTDNDPSVDNEQDKQDCIDNDYLGGHGHVDKTHDGTVDGDASSWGYWTCGGYAAATGTSDANCPDPTDGSGNNDDSTTPPPPQNPPPQNPPPAEATSLVKISGDGQEGLINTELTNPFIVEARDQNNNLFGGATVTFAITAGSGSLSTETTTTNTSGRAESTLTLGTNLGTTTVSVSLSGTQETETFSAEAVETLTPGDNNNDGNPGQNTDNGGNNGDNNGRNNDGGNNNDNNNGGGNNQKSNILLRSEPEPVATSFYEFELDLYAGWNFVHIPLEVTQVNGESMSIETVGNLFQVLIPAHMYIYDGDRWIEVFSDSEQALSTNQGVAVYMNAPLTVSLVGLPLATIFSLQRGLTFVGIPRQSSDLPKVSDFLTFYPKLCVVFLASEGKVYLVGRAGDPGDIKIIGGQAFGIISLSQYLTGFYGKPWGTELSE